MKSMSGKASLREEQNSRAHKLPALPPVFQALLFHGFAISHHTALQPLLARLGFTFPPLLAKTQLTEHFIYEIPLSGIALLVSSAGPGF